MGYVIYLISKRRIEKRYKPEYDRGRRLEPHVNNVRLSQPRYISPINNNGSPRVDSSDKGNISNVERIKRAFRKA